MAVEGLEIVQVVRRVGPGGGVGGVAAALDRAFGDLGVATQLVTARGGPAPAGWLGHMREVVGFSLRGGRAGRQAAGAGGAVVVVHGDALGGDIYVDHGLHRALLARRPWLLVHPLHLFIAVREAWRHARPRHRRTACLSAGAVEALRRWHPLSRRTPAAVLANGVDLERFRPDPGRMAHATTLQDCRLVFVGHEFGRKGLRHLLAALRLLPAGVGLTVVGGDARAVHGAERRARRLGVADRVRFLGRRADVERVLSEADVLVLPSALEASPLAALEAMACGVPVLLAGAPSGEALLGHGRGGRVIQASPAAIAGALQALLADGEAFLQLRQSARAHAETLSWRRVAAGYVALAQAVRRERDGP